MITTVRHGETEWSRAGRHTGRTDIALTENGRQQAEATGRRLAGMTWSLVLCSPLRRARETCRLAGLGDQAVIDDDLCEWDYGDYEGLTTQQIHQHDPSWSLWRDGCPGGEQPVDVGARADRVIARAGATDGEVIVFAHGHVLRVLGARWIAEAPAFGGRLMLSTAGMSVLGWEHDVPVLASWNDTSHLAVSGETSSEGRRAT